MEHIKDPLSRVKTLRKKDGSRPKRLKPAVIDRAKANVLVKTTRDEGVQSRAERAQASEFVTQVDVQK